MEVRCKGNDLKFVLLEHILSSSLILRPSSEHKRKYLLQHTEITVMFFSPNCTDSCNKCLTVKSNLSAKCLLAICTKTVQQKKSLVLLQQTVATLG